MNRHCEICGCELWLASHAKLLKYGFAWTCPRCGAGYYSGWVTAFQMILTYDPYEVIE